MKDFDQEQEGNDFDLPVKKRGRKRKCDIQYV
jgi:hypothetical protein